MPKLLPIPAELARPRYPQVDLRGSTELIAALRKWKKLLITRFGGSEDGVLVVNSAYRPRGTTCGNDSGGRIDRTDANGHWTGCALDYSARLTSWCFWGEGCPKWHRDDLRDALAVSGLFHPWYWRYSHGRRIRHEYWHIAVEVAPWRQSRAFREPVPPWYGGLRA